MKKNRKKKEKYVSLFTKSVIALITIGILPLVIMGLSIYNAYLDSIKDTMLSNMYRTTLSVGRSIQDIIHEMEENTKYLYSIQIEGYGYMYQLLEDTSVSDNRKNMLITDVLRNILYMNPYIDHVLFILENGEIYSAMRSPESMLNTSRLQSWHLENFRPESKQMQLISTHTADYYMGCRKRDFSVSRNIMNTKTIQSADTEIMGTLYIDISEEYLDNVINETKLEEGSRIYIIDKKEHKFIYAPQDDATFDTTEILEKCLDKMDTQHQYLKTREDYLIYSDVPDTDWMIIERVPSFNLENSYEKIRNTTLLIIGCGSVSLIFIYYFYSKKSNQPIRNLKEAMESVQQGNLDTRVEIRSNDEIGYLAQGMNNMTEKLQGHIKKVYIAEIRQREAEIEALKTQIQPHYLYNTLDVIRMTAITNDDKETAEMIDGLSGQLKYLMGSARDMVALKDEIESVRNYFKIIHIRYENRFSLEIDMEDKLLDLKVPQLILQPVVENAVKYGLRPKEGEGVVAIRGKIENGQLEISVMDNGVGMTPQRLSYVRELLGSEETVNHPKSKRASIGLKNVYDRIKLIFGEEYHIEISSFLDIGTIVKYKLPVVKHEIEQQNVTGGENV